MKTCVKSPRRIQYPFGILKTSLARSQFWYVSQHRMSTLQQYTPPDISSFDTQTWCKMNKDLREEIIEYLDWKMEGNWNQMGKDELRAAYIIGFGKWGPRATKGSKEDQQDMSTPEIIVRGIFSSILFTALGICVLNYQKDKSVQQKLDALREISDMPSH